MYIFVKLSTIRETSLFKEIEYEFKVHYKMKQKNPTLIRRELIPSTK